MFAAHDANYNCIGLTDKAGNEVEKYYYTPYGRVVVDQLSGRGDFDGDGDVDAADDTIFDDAFTGPDNPAPEEDLICDLDGDGDVDLSDLAIFGAAYGSDYRKPGLAFSGVGNDRLFTMQTLDPETLNYHYKARWYNPCLGRFGQRDPLAFRPFAHGGHQDGMSLYAYARGNPLQHGDSLGLQATQPCGRPKPCRKPNGATYPGCKDGECTPIISEEDQLKHPFVVDCIEEHEKEHCVRIPFVIPKCLDPCRGRGDYCAACTGKSVADFDPSLGPGPRSPDFECPAFRQQRDCLDLKLPQCGSESCRREVERSACRAGCWVSYHCNNAPQDVLCSCLRVCELGWGCWPQDRLCGCWWEDQP